MFAKGHFYIFYELASNLVLERKKIAAAGIELLGKISILKISWKLSFERKRQVKQVFGACQTLDLLNFLDL